MTAVRRARQTEIIALFRLIRLNQQKSNFIMSHLNFIVDRKLNIVQIPISALPKTHLNIFKVLLCNCFFFPLNMSTFTVNQPFVCFGLLLCLVKRKKTRSSVAFTKRGTCVINSLLRVQILLIGLAVLTSDWLKMTIFRYLSKQGEISV